MTKCDQCEKNITKRSPGLECSKCGKIVHANQLCSGLPPKQLSALRNSESLDWTCEECSRNSPKKKSSLIVPDEDDDEDIDGAFSQNLGSIDAQKLLRDISSSVKKIVRKETEAIEDSMNYFGKKIEEFGGMMEVFTGKIKELENKQTYLLNKNKHLETKVSSLEVQIRKMEQSNLETKVEIAGVPKSTNENITEIACNVAKLLDLDHKNIVNVKRADGRTGSDGPLLVELADTELAVNWARASKKEAKPILAEHVVPGIPQEAAKSKVIVRRALTKANKTLLWNAQQKLRPAYKYVWFQAGKVLVKKGDNDKPLAIWCEEDLTQIAS